MRKVAVVSLFAFAVVLSTTGSAVTPPSRFVGTWIITQGAMMSDGTPIPFDVFSIPEFMHIDPGNEVRALSGLFHPSSIGTVWPVYPGRSLSVPVNAGIGIGDWEYGPGDAVVLKYHVFLYDRSNRPIGYAHVVRTLDAIPTEPLADGAEEVLTGTALLRFFDLNGQPLALPLGEHGMTMYGLGGPFRATRAATAR